MRILYVEDNPANVLLVKRVAKMGHHEVVNFMDGKEALAKFEDVNPHLVLMDVQIAGEMNGLDVVRKLRELGYTTPIVAVTAYAMVGDKERCLEAGCDDYMPKPLPVAELVKMFEEYAKTAVATMPDPAPTVSEVKDARHTPAVATRETLAVSVPKVATSEAPQVPPAPSTPEQAQEETPKETSEVAQAKAEQEDVTQPASANPEENVEQS